MSSFLENLKKAKDEIKELKKPPKKKERKHYDNEEEKKEARQKSKYEWAKRNEEVVKDHAKVQGKKREKKIRYLIEKYHDEIGLRVRDYKIFEDENMTNIKDEFIKDYLDKLNENKQKKLNEVNTRHMKMSG